MHSLQYGVLVRTLLRWLLTASATGLCRICGTWPYRLQYTSLSTRSPCAVLLRLRPPAGVFAEEAAEHILRDLCLAWDLFASPLRELSFGPRETPKEKKKVCIVLQIEEKIVEVVQIISQEPMSARIDEPIVDVAVPRVLDEVVQNVLQNVITESIVERIVDADVNVRVPQMQGK